jgi:GTP-dependent phosphoenolpyruvate carboxykinase
MLLYKKEWYEEHGYNWKHGVHVTATNVLLQTLLITAKSDTMTFFPIKIIQMLQILK